MANCGWSVQPWSSSPWGGGPCPGDGQTAGWERYERVRRQWEWKEEREREERNVVFRVKGVRGIGHIGHAFASGGRGLQSFPYGARAFARSNPARAEVLTEARLISSQQVQALIGRATVESSVGVAAVRARGFVGKPAIKAVRNLSDEELIHFLLDIT